MLAGDRFVVRVCQRDAGVAVGDPRHESEPGPPLLDDAAQVVDGGHEHGAPGGRERVGAATVVRRERRDEPVLLEAADRLVEGARTEPNTGELLDVLHQGVAVLVLGREAHEYEERRPAQRGLPFVVSSPEGHHSDRILHCA